MDRTAWIVVTLCVAGLLGWGWWSTKEAGEYAAQQRAWQEYQQKLAAENPVVEEKVEAAGQPGADAAKGTGAATPSAAAPAEGDIAVKELTLANDEIRVHLTNRGGGIATAELLDHQRSLEADKGFVVINDRGDHVIGALSTGPKEIDQTVWEITEETDKAVTFTTVTPEKLRISKRFALPEEGGEAHQLTLQIAVTNENAQPWQLGNRFLYLGSAGPLHAGEWPRQTGFYFRDEDGGKVTYKGVDYFKGKKFLGIGSDGKPHDELSIGMVDWAGINDQYFTTLLTPKESYATTMWASRFPITLEGQKEVSEKKQLNAVEGALGLPDLSLAPGEVRSLDFELYLGPKEFDRLKQLGDHRSLVMKYDDTPIFGALFGWAIRPLASGLIVVLKTLHNWVGSWGVSIILVTILIRLVIWPVYAKSTRTMKRMSKLTPMMTEIKEKYKDDQERQSKELMKLYGEYGVNPLGGCLPMFIQMPVFLAFYGMLWRAVELRHENFLWIADLSMPDTLFMIPSLNIPFNLLPLLMAGTTFIQMSMTPKSGDKTQQMVFKFMPLFFLVICYNFASALALYWTTQNIFSIFQTWLMNRLPEPELKKRKRKNGKSFMERMQEQAAAREKGGSGGSQAPGAANRTKLASEKGDRHTKGKKKKR
ncbi:MAG: membrane protein insertase YidC [Verrucomicrobiae bacterium]|nr:membrane protein insertase YidC [Verrucomicrobiae bacterium]